ncbi:MAG: DNA polymerase III subunit delta [Dissulfurispiraceae bacterium]|jgi:DNA polymerase III delta subunit
MKAFYNELAKKMPAGCYVIHSEDDYLLYESLKAIRTELGAEQDLFITYDFEDPDNAASINNIINDANSMPFFSSGARKVIVVRGLNQLFKRRKSEGDEEEDDEEEEEGKKSKKGKPSKKDALPIINAYIDNPASFTLLVFMFKGKKPDMFPKAKMLPVSISEYEIPQWVSYIASKRGISFTPRAIDYLILATQGNFGMLYSEIEKCQGFFSRENAKVIEPNDLKAIVYMDAEANTFALGDALLRREKRSAFKIMDMLTSKKSPAEMILGGINWKLTQGKQMSLQIAELLHEADIGVKLARPHTLENLLLEFFNLKD